MRRFAIITQCSIERNKVSVKMLDGCEYSMTTSSEALYNLLRLAREECEEELVYDILIGAASDVLKKNDVFYDEIEII